MMIDKAYNVCKQVIENCYPNHDYNRGSVSCPFCAEESYGEDMDDIKHDDDCAYTHSKELLPILEREKRLSKILNKNLDTKE